MSVLHRELIRYNDSLYEVIRKHPENRIKPDKVDELRQHINCDVTLKKDGFLFYCKMIQDAQLVN